VTDLAFDLYLLAAALGLVPAVAFAGMPVLAQSAFLALGAVGAMQLERAGLPIGSAVLLAVLGGAVAGALLGVLLAPAPRARVALATWGLAWLATTALLAFPGLSGGTQGLTRPALDNVETYLGLSLTLTPTAHAVLAVILCALALATAERLRNGPAGRDAVALREDAEAALALGVPVAARKAALLAIAGAFGAAAGAGFSLLIGVAAPADTSPLLALQLFAAVIVGAGAPVAGPLLAFAVIAGVPRLASALSETGLSSEASNGVVTAAALIACLWLRPHVAARTRRRGSSGAPPDPRALNQPARGSDPVEGSSRVGAGRGLVARGVADPIGILEGLDLDLRGGETHALIGPNGSGKTTALRVLGGALRPASGTVTPGARRTFQRAAPLHPLTPYEQVQLALPRERFGALLAFIGLGEEDDPWPALELAGLTDRAHTPAGGLGAGEERLLQIARVAATGARVLLIDEPAAGMRPDERATLERVLRRLVGQGRAVLVVEHDLRLVASAADTVTVLDEGRVIASGTPDAIIADTTVRKVYLGT
jgi:ABC-type branched-subunit amino acid transport system ATPase component/ABC-type branched-subunit amino acid transport system permease subunit